MKTYRLAGLGASDTHMSAGRIVTCSSWMFKVEAWCSSLLATPLMIFGCTNAHCLNDLTNFCEKSTRVPRMAVEYKLLEAGISTRSHRNIMYAWLPFSSKAQYSQYCNKNVVHL